MPDLFLEASVEAHSAVRHISRPVASEILRLREAVPAIELVVSGSTNEGVAAVAPLDDVSIAITHENVALEMRASDVFNIRNGVQALSRGDALYEVYADGSGTLFEAGQISPLTAAQEVVPSLAGQRVVTYCLLDLLHLSAIEVAIDLLSRCRVVTSSAVVALLSLFVASAAHAEATCNGRSATLTGTPGDDVLVGTAGADVIVARAGDDLVRAGGGEDTICGGDGADRIFGEEAGDRAYGERGADRVVGGSEPDDLSGGAGSDNVRGGSSDDRLLGGRGNDFVTGVGGFDVILLDAGDDVLSGGRATNTLRVDHLRDSLLVDLQEGLASGAGTDVLIDGTITNVFNFTNQASMLIGDAQGNWLIGGSGSDRLYGAEGNDRLTAGGGGFPVEGVVTLWGDQDGASGGDRQAHR